MYARRKAHQCIFRLHRLGHEAVGADRAQVEPDRQRNSSLDKALTRGQEDEVKNYRARLVELTSRATDALERQRAITGEGTHVFVGEDGKPYTTTDGPLDAWRKPAMAASGMRYRDAR